MVYCGIVRRHRLRKYQYDKNFHKGALFLKHLHENTESFKKGTDVTEFFKITISPIYNYSAG